MLQRRSDIHHVNHSHFAVCKQSVVRPNFKRLENVNLLMPGNTEKSLQHHQRVYTNTININENSHHSFNRVGNSVISEVVCMNLENIRWLIFPSSCILHTSVSWISTYLYLCIYLSVLSRAGSELSGNRNKDWVTPTSIKICILISIIRKPCKENREGSFPTRVPVPGKLELVVHFT